MKRRIYQILFSVVSVIFVVSSAVLVKTLYEYRKAEAEYEEIAGQSVKVLPGASYNKKEGQAAAGSKTGEQESGAAGSGGESTDLDRILVIDFEGLKRENPDVTGWLDIPGTSISYPVVQAADNDFYLSHGIRKQRSGSGAIFMDSRNDAGLGDGNTIIYGHNMRNGSMFGSLRKFKDSQYRASRPYVDYYIPGMRIRYAVYACYEETADWKNFPVDFADEAEQAAYCSAARKKSLYDTGTDPEPGSHTMMLSTCTGSGYTKRWVIQAVEQERTPVEAPLE